MKYQIVYYLHLITTSRQHYYMVTCYQTIYKIFNGIRFQNTLPFHSDLVLTPTPAGGCEHEALQSVSSLPSNTEIVCYDQMTQYCDWMIQYSILNYL